MTPMDIDPDQVVQSPWVAGFLGSVVGLRFAPGLTRWERITNVAAGMLCAVYVSPALAEWLHITGTSVRAAAAFGVGMFGLSVAAEIAKSLRDGHLRALVGNVWPFKRS